MMSYECLLTALPSLYLDRSLPISLEALEAFLQEGLSEDDRAQLRLLQIDAQNDIFREQVAVLEDNITIQPDWWDELFHTLSYKDLLVHLLFQFEQGAFKLHRNIFAVEGQQSVAKPCAFIREWFAFNQSVNNVLVAKICVKHHLPTSKSIIGTDELATYLRKADSVKNLGLRGMMDSIDDILSIAEIENLMEREKAIDTLKWTWLQNRTQFDYFSLSNVLVYYLQVKILSRWSELSVERGEVVFNDIVKGMKSGIKIEI